MCESLKKAYSILAIMLLWLFRRNVKLCFLCVLDSEIQCLGGGYSPGQRPCPNRPAQDFRLSTHTQAALMRIKRQAVRSLWTVRALTNICVLVQ